MMGGKLGLITVSDKWTPRIMHNVRRLDMERRVVGAEGLETTPIELKKAMVDDKRRDGVIADFLASARRLLDKGAEFIVCEGGDVIVFLAEAGIYEVDRAPVINGIVELIKMSETAVSCDGIRGASRRSGSASAHRAANISNASVPFTATKSFRAK